MNRDLPVRPVLDDERPAILSVIHQAYAEFESALAAQEWLRLSANLAGIVAPGAPGVLIAAFDGPEAIGTATYLPPGPREYNRVPEEWAVVRGMAVLPAWRGRGVARALLTDCLGRARSDGALWVGLHTAALMHAARRLYEGVGFVQQGGFLHLGLPFCIYALHLEAPHLEAPHPEHGR
ncbi:MAG: GNAT family N-acetyltransferase [Actinomycetota bacterium]|nr:GNAT family N-acetyltransferase [Actinomycetota bacterium]